MDKRWLVWWVMECAPKYIENLDGGIMHDAFLPSFHHGTYPRHLNCQVFTSGRIFFNFNFLTFLTCLSFFLIDVGRMDGKGLN